MDVLYFIILQDNKIENIHRIKSDFFIFIFLEYIVCSYAIIYKVKNNVQLIKLMSLQSL